MRPFSCTGWSGGGQCAEKKTSNEEVDCVVDDCLYVTWHTGGK